MYYFKKLSLCYLIVGVIFLTGCSKDPGTPPELLVDGTAIVVGETTPSSLSKSGFTTINLLDYLMFELPEKSWTSSFNLYKDDVSYASLCLVNDSKEEKMVGQCTIEEVKFSHLEDDRKDLDISINGFNPIGKTQEELKELYPELILDDDVDDDTQTHRINNGDYYIYFQYDKGVMTEIEVKHSFSKSYKEK